MLHPITIQTLFFKLDGVGPSANEIEKYIEVLTNLIQQHITIDEVQIHSLARKPAEESCSGLETSQLRLIAGKIAYKIDVKVKVY